MNIISQVAQGMQAILSCAAEIIAFNTGVIQRLRKFTGSVFVQTLVFGWLSHPKATLEDLTQTAATLGLSITPQGLDKRFTSVCANFILKVLEAAVATVIAEKPVAIPVLHRFAAVYIQDSSTITLPDVRAVIWQGCGGRREKNTRSSLKTQIRLNLNPGELIGPYLQSGKENDLRSFLSLPLPKGALWDKRKHRLTHPHTWFTIPNTHQFLSDKHSLCR
ncbi:hypothetical protein FJZ31_19715 [Candidatus Poribacteria bacterium]|nr:hypothetical protein [Candidatus Poribacteria bacterium]